MGTAMSNETGTRPVLQRKSPFRIHGQLLLLMGLVVLLAIVAIGGYAFHWTWTGFQSNTLWDWLVLLLLPVALVVAKLAYAEYDHHKKAMENARQAKQASIQS